MVQKKILIIEDDQSLVKLIRGALELNKFLVEVASEAQEGCSRALLGQPDLIILDILLPTEDGFACLRYLKDHPQTKNIPVIILSNLGQDQELRKGLELGAVDYLVKADVGIDEIITKIAKYLNP